MADHTNSNQPIMADHTNSNQPIYVSDIPFSDIPFIVDVKKGETYWWCACGRSMSQPFCDGSHEGTTIQPLAYTASCDCTLYLCGCKQTKKPPFCDGSHNTLSRRKTKEASGYLYSSSRQSGALAPERSRDKSHEQHRQLRKNQSK